MRYLDVKNFKIDIDMNKFWNVYCSCTSVMYESKFWKKKLPGSKFCSDCIGSNREIKLNQILKDDTES